MEAAELGRGAGVGGGALHRGVLWARSEYFCGLLLSGMQEDRGQQEITLGEASARRSGWCCGTCVQPPLPLPHRVSRPPHPPTAAVPAWEELQGAGRAVRGPGAAAGGHGGRGKGGGNGGGGGTGKGKGKEEAGGEDDKGAVRTALELAVLKATELFQAEGVLLKHYLEGFRSGLSVHKVVEQLVWVHNDGPAEARTVATEFLATHSSVIRVCCCRLACFIDDVSGGEFLALKCGAEV